MTRRPGHSIPELLVAVVFLGTTLVSVGGAAWLGGHWLDAALLRQAAIRRAAATLDSLARAPAFAAGAAHDSVFAVTWTPGPGGRIRVSVRRVTGRDPGVTLVGAGVPRVPVLPDPP